jgi:hypothetical protein
MIFKKKYFWRGESNELYRFSICHSVDDVPTYSGIYVFARRRFIFFIKPLYVGKARNLWQRIDGHDRWLDAQNKGANEIHIRHADEVKLDRIEEDIIRFLKPKLNNIHIPRGDLDAPNHKKLRSKWMSATEYWSLNDPKPKRRKRKSTAKSYWDIAA